MSSVYRSVRALAFAAVVGCMWIAPQAASAQSSQAPVKVELPLYYVTTNPCNLELVSITGTQNLFFYFKQNSAGATNLALRIKNFGKGDGSSGGSYLFHSEESFTFNDLSSGTNELTMQTKTMVIRQGEIGPGTPDDFIFKITLHATANANGIVTAMPANVIIACPGAES